MKLETITVSSEVLGGSENRLKVKSLKVPQHAGELVGSAVPDGVRHGHELEPDSPEIGESCQNDSEPVKQIIVVGNHMEDHVEGSSNDEVRGGELASDLEEVPLSAAFIQARLDVDVLHCVSDRSVVENGVLRMHDGDVEAHLGERGGEKVLSVHDWKRFTTN